MYMLLRPDDEVLFHIWILDERPQSAVHGTSLAVAINADEARLLHALPYEGPEIQALRFIIDMLRNGYSAHTGWPEGKLKAVAELRRGIDMIVQAVHEKEHPPCDFCDQPATGQGWTKDGFLGGACDEHRMMLLEKRPS